MLETIRIIAIALGAVACLATLVAAIEGRKKRRPKEPVMDAEFKEWLRRVDSEVFGECK